METRAEINRLTQVYREYQDCGWDKTKWSAANPGNSAIQEERHRKLGGLLENAGFQPLHNKRVLDVGCGTGEVLAGFTRWGARPKNLFGIDLLGERVRRARSSYPELTFQEANAEAMPFARGSFDLVSVFTVFTSILDLQMARNVSLEIDRVLRPGGAVVWYDFRFNNPANRHVRGIGRREIRRLFPPYESRLCSITLVPPLARRCGRFAGILYPSLASLPFLRSHYLGILRKPRV